MTGGTSSTDFGGSSTSASGWGGMIVLPVCSGRIAPGRVESGTAIWAWGTPEKIKPIRINDSTRTIMSERSPRTLTGDDRKFLIKNLVVIMFSALFYQLLFYGSARIELFPGSNVENIAGRCLSGKAEFQSSRKKFSSLFADYSDVFSRATPVSITVLQGLPDFHADCMPFKRLRHRICIELSVGNVPEPKR